MDAHSALDSAEEGVLFIKGKVVARLRTQKNDRFLQCADLWVCDRCFLLACGRFAIQASEELVWQLFRWGNDICQPGIDRAARHAVEFGGFRILH